MELWELAAREAIRDLVARYNANGDSGRFEPVLELFTEDAVLEVPPEERYVGHDGIRTLLTQTALPSADAPMLEHLRHFTATHQIDLLDRERARGRCYYAVLTQTGLDHWGVYMDRYRASDGVWRFESRRVSVDGRVPGGFADSRMRSEQRGA